MQDDDAGDADAGPAESGELAEGGEEPIDAIAETPPGEESFWARTLPLVEMDRRDRWIEIISAVLLALATVASAWSAYQTARWGGEQSTQFSTASSLRTESVRASNDAGNLVTIDASIWLDWLDAISNDDLVRVEFLQDRMRDEFRPALDNWLESADAVAGDVPTGTPFEQDAAGEPVYGYVVERAEEAKRLEAEATVAFDEAKEANQNSDNFVLLTVAFASVLFFAGVGAKFKSVRVRVAVLSFGGAVFVIALLFLLSLPQNVGV